MPGNPHILYLRAHSTKTGWLTSLPAGARCSCGGWSTWVTDEGWARELWALHVAEVTGGEA